jgi:hypothetical protein
LYLKLLSGEVPRLENSHEAILGTNKALFVADLASSHYITKQPRTCNSPPRDTAINLATRPYYPESEVQGSYFSCCRHR